MTTEARKTETSAPQCEENRKLDSQVIMRERVVLLFRQGVAFLLATEENSRPF